MSNDNGQQLTASLARRANIIVSLKLIKGYCVSDKLHLL